MECMKCKQICAGSMNGSLNQLLSVIT